MKVLFLHGWHSTPGGRKPTYLADLGYQVLNPKLCPDDYDAALRTAQQAYDEGEPEVVIGSSRGGAIAMNIEIGSTPLILMCPAWKNWGRAQTVKTGTQILHSSTDEIIPFKYSEELLASSGLSAEHLLDVGEGHRLADEAALKALAEAVERVSQA